MVNICEAQMFIKTADLFPSSNPNGSGGTLRLHQDNALDTLVSRYILGNKIMGGLEGYRIQIFRSSQRNAREESSKVRAGFMNDFPDIPCYADYAEPGYFLVRIGDFRSKTEGTKLLYQIRRKYPNAYMVVCTINFPDQVKK